MLDTNILIHYLKNRPPSVAARIDALDDDDLLRMSFATYAELLVGAQGSTRKAAVQERAPFALQVQEGAHLRERPGHALPLREGTSTTS